MKKYNLLFYAFLLFCLTTITFAQNAKITELKLRLKNATHDTTKVITLYKIGVHYNSLGEYKTALEYINKSIRLSESINYVSGCAGAYNNAGVSYFYLSNYSEALKHYFKALKYSNLSNNKTVLVNASINIGIIYAIQKEYDQAASYFEEASKALIEIHDTKALGELYTNLGSLYAEQGKYIDALKVFALAIKYYDEWGSKEGIRNAYNNIGNIYKIQGNYDKALDMHYDALKIANEIKDKSGIVISNNDIGEIYNLKEMPEKAILYFNEGLKIAKEKSIISSIADSYKGLSIGYTKIKKFDLALISYQNYVLFKDSMFNEENTKKLVSAEMQYNFDKKEAAIKAKQAIKDAIAKEKIQQQRIVILSVILGSALLLLSLLFFINRRRTKHALEVNKLENKTLRSQLNPHFIFNALASIQKYMNEYPDKAENYLAKFAKLMRAVLENSEKEYISLEDEFEMLKNYMDLEKLRVKNGFTYQFNIHENIDLEEIQTPPLLLQPIIENAIWHGVAKDEGHGEIIINVDKANEFLRFEIENKSDIKFEEQVANNTALEGKRKSFGQQIVRERLNLLSKEKGKKCQIEMASTAHGMKVIVLIPNLN